MKSIRVTPNEKVESKFITLFDSAEAAYAWAIESREDPNVINYIQDVDKVEILQGEFAEVEWRGCEFSHEKAENLRFDFVRLAKARTAKNSSGLLVTVHVGWTCDQILPFKDYSDDTMVITKLTSKTARLNMATIFKDNVEKETGLYCELVRNNMV